MTTLTVLLAEDSLVNQKLAVALLRRRNATVIVAANGMEAVEAWEEHAFDVILMDVQMPLMDGLDATRLIRSRERDAAHTPIIAVSAADMTSDREECLAAGMDAYLSKPIRAAELMQLIDRLALTSTAPVDFVSRASMPTQIFEHARLRSNVGGDDALIAELLGIFTMDAPLYVKTMRLAAANGDRRAVLDAAHALKGAAGSITASRLAQVARSMERAAGGGNMAGIDASITEIERELNLLDTELQSLGLLTLLAV